MQVLVCIGWFQRFSFSDLYFSGEYFAWVALGYATLFATLFAYNAISWAVLRLPPGVVTAYSTLQPVGTVLLSFLIWGRMVTLPEGVGGFLVALGLVATVVARKWEDDSAEENIVVESEGDASTDDKESAAEPLLLSLPDDNAHVENDSKYSMFSPSKHKNTLRSIFL